MLSQPRSAEKGGLRNAEVIIEATIWTEVNRWELRISHAKLRTCSQRGIEHGMNKWNTNTGRQAPTGTEECYPRGGMPKRQGGHAVQNSI